MSEFTNDELLIMSQCTDEKLFKKVVLFLLDWNVLSVANRDIRFLKKNQIFEVGDEEFQALETGIFQRYQKGNSPYWLHSGLHVDEVEVYLNLLTNKEKEELFMQICFRQGMKKAK